MKLDLEDWIKPAYLAKELSEKNGYKIKLQRVNNWIDRGRIQSQKHPQLGTLVKRGTLDVRKHNGITLIQ